MRREASRGAQNPGEPASSSPQRQGSTFPWEPSQTRESQADREPTVQPSRSELAFDAQMAHSRAGYALWHLKVLMVVLPVRALFNMTFPRVPQKQKCCVFCFLNSTQIHLKGKHTLGLKGKWNSYACLSFPFFFLKKESVSKAIIGCGLKAGVIHYWPLFSAARSLSVP